MAVFIPIVHVGWTVIVKVLSRAFDSIVKSLTLNFAKLGGRCVPSSIVILGDARRFGHYWCGRSLAITRPLVPSERARPEKAIHVSFMIETLLFAVRDEPIASCVASGVARAVNAALSAGI